MIKLIKAIALVVTLALFTAGCKDSYFADGGEPASTSGELGVSTVDYLKANPASFDTLARLIKLTGLEDAVNAKGNTFLDPRDYSIHNYLKLIYPTPASMPATLEAIPQQDMNKIAEMLKDYIIPNQQIVRSDLATTYSYVTTYGNKKARFNIVTSDYLGNVNLGAKSIIFSLNLAPAGDKESYQAVTVVTADLKSTNGIVHVLDSNAHIFGFN